MIIRDVINNRPPEILSAWLCDLGSFEMLTPHDAAERWGCSVIEAMERLHAMCGGPLEIPMGQVERYVRAEWTAEAAAPSRAKEKPYKEIMERRIELMGDDGVTTVMLAQKWQLRKAQTERVLYQMVRDGLVRSAWVGRKKTWYRI